MSSYLKFERVTWDDSGMHMWGQTTPLVIGEHQFHGKLRQVPLKRLDVLELGLGQSTWRLCDISVSRNGISSRASSRSQKRHHKKFIELHSPPVPDAPTSIWVHRSSRCIFALCAGPVDTADVLVMKADDEEGAKAWIMALAGRLQLNYLNLDEDLLPEYLYLFERLAEDGLRMALPALQVGLEACSYARSEEELVTLITKLGVQLDSTGSINVCQYLRIIAHCEASLAAEDSTSVPRELILGAFRQLDPDGLGFVSANALVYHLQQRGQSPMAEKEIRSFLPKRFIDVDGRINYTPFVDSWLPQLPRVRDAPSHFDDRLRI